MIDLLALETSIMGVTLWNWLKALAIVIGFMIVGKITYHLLVSGGKWLVSKTKTEVDDLILHVIQGPLILVFLIGGLYFSFTSLGIQNIAVNDSFNKLLFILTTIGAAWFLSRFFDQFIKRAMMKIAEKTKSELDDQLIPIFSKAVKITIWILAGVVAASNVGIDVTAVLAGAGIIGIALAFAAQETIANVFGGVSLLVDRSFKIGDRLKLETGEVGYVYEITLRSTKLRTPAGEGILIPNGQLAKMRITNTSIPTRELRMDVPFSVAYGTNITKTEKVILSCLKNFPQISQEKDYEVLLMKMNDFSLDFVARFWVNDYLDYDLALPKVNKAIYDALQKNNIEIPFPTRTIYMKKEKGRKS